MTLKDMLLFMFLFIVVVLFVAFIGYIMWINILPITC